MGGPHIELVVISQQDACTRRVEHRPFDVDGLESLVKSDVVDDR